mmetsp:Transcript_55346/g.82332  ORF Transcript_55346/g.82332 Transcript_55346/m.82332 type:complete len:114 (-) Transcript_55346:671-1012(-)
MVIDVINDDGNVQKTLSGHRSSFPLNRVKNISENARRNINNTTINVISCRMMWYNALIKIAKSMAILLRKYTTFPIITMKETEAKIRKSSNSIAPVFITMVVARIIRINTTSM